ncbi:MAG: D-mannonate epimerase, partial [Clostridia bacterium]|nr:D-mannonate epimerase [Clostridia bacterium]
RVHGLFIGRERKYFEDAVVLAQQKNLNLVDEPFDKVVVLLDEQEFKSTWLGNKSVYRTRMAIKDGGELIVLAPGVDKFGEDPGIDKLIRKYGYCGRVNVLKLVKEHEDLRQNLSAAAHLIHGSSDGRFSITYCTRLLTKEEVEGVCFGYIPYDEAAEKYDPAKLRDGFNTLPDGEKIYYISNPALGLWADRSKF